ncbi:MAG: restriction system modified-DNA reader domain-containing protein, partial [Planctomycetota bacterium]
TYKAVVYYSGIIKLEGKIYNTPSSAAKAIIDTGARNGWRFWKYKDKSGELVPLSELR